MIEYCAVCYSLYMAHPDRGLSTMSIGVTHIDGTTVCASHLWLFYNTLGSTFSTAYQVAQSIADEAAG